MCPETINHFVNRESEKPHVLAIATTVQDLNKTAMSILIHVVENVFCLK